MVGVLYLQEHGKEQSRTASDRQDPGTWQVLQLRVL